MIHKNNTSSHSLLHRLIKICKRSDGVFVVLRVNSPPKGVFIKSKMKKMVTDACIQTVSTENGLPFYVLDVPEGMNLSMWGTVEKKCGRYASRIVAPRSITLPDSGKIRRFVPCSTPSSLTFNTAVKTLKKANISPEKISITVSDINARQAPELCRILPFASVIKVVTAYPEKYASACEKAFNDYGASVLLRSCYEPSSKHDVIICCDGRLAPSAHNAAVFSCKSRTFGKLHFKGSGADLTANHSKIIPENINPIDFIGAVTELCGSSDYKNACFRDIAVSCEKCTNSSPATCLECFASEKL